MSSDRLPDFFIVGAAKSGTTSLWQYLGQHPGIFMTDDIGSKELGYFCNHYGIKKKEQYVAYFEKALPGQLVGESCHAYLSSPESASMIYREVPRAKIIMVLRNPVDRAYSLYNWMASNGYEPALTFEKALKMEAGRFADDAFKTRNPQGFYMNYLYVRSGLYYEQVKRYFDRFGRENCEIILFDELKKNPAAQVGKICSFLGIPDFSPDIKIHNESQQVKDPVRQFYLRFEFPKKLERFGLSKQFSKKIAEKLMQMNVKKEKPRPILQATRV